MDEAFWAPRRADYDAFFAAVSSGRIEEVRMSLNNDMNINALFGEPCGAKTTLHIAAAAGHVDILEFLLANGSLVDSFALSNFGTSTALHMAAFCGRSAAVKVLLDNGADINAVCDQDGIALHEVLRNKEYDVIGTEHIRTIELLLNHGSDLYSVCIELGGTVIHQAAELGSIDVLEALVSRGVDVNIDVASCNSVLSSSVSYEQHNAAKWLIQHGAKVDKTALESATSTYMMDLLISNVDEDIFYDCNALHRACTRGESGIEMIAFLIGKGLRIEKIDTWGDTPLLSVCGCRSSSSEVVQVLLKHGANASAQGLKEYTNVTLKGDTPLHRASWGSDPKVVKLLLEAGADLAARNDKGQTPLILYAYRIDHVSQYFDPMLGHRIRPRVHTLKMIIEAGADVNATDLKKRTSLHALALSGNLGAEARIEAFRILLDAGVSVSAVDDEGRTVSDILLHRKEQQLADLVSTYT